MKFPTIVVRPPILRSWMTISGFSHSDMAGELEVSKSRVSQLLSAKTEPSAHLMAKLIILTGLPFHRLFKIQGRAVSPQGRNGRPEE